MVANHVIANRVIFIGLMKAAEHYMSKLRHLFEQSYNKLFPSCSFPNQDV